MGETHESASDSSHGSIGALADYRYVIELRVREILASRMTARQSHIAQSGSDLIDEVGMDPVEFLESLLNAVQELQVCSTDELLRTGRTISGLVDLILDGVGGGIGRPATRL